LGAKRVVLIIAAGVALTALDPAPAAASGAAAPTRAAVVVVPAFPLERYAAAGAVGLLVPGSGAWVSRAGARAALVRGKVQNALLGGVPNGKPLIALSRRPGPITIYV
jgi:hypothetical protein